MVGRKRSVKGPSSFKEASEPQRFPRKVFIEAEAPTQNLNATRMP